ncbi:tetratricopeptide/SEL1-like repeat protein [Actinomadura soli]|uniref:Tetratricopeptide/SEL1-like repeat protein n=1 Tax=Actinomadura soli TaxID=2508997 RepID=A0A5C4JGG7_9ACTN|nr:tetratricopeptide/SEL1-like repeat protein [Actinomadura soli]TMR04819.1 tetratricopeptide/SEL1-like repeat protein [Actinomadura soli]
MRDAGQSAEAIVLHEEGLRARREGDPAEAERCFREAFEQGRAVAAHDLAGLLLSRGDKAGAEEWYRRAAEQGVPESAFEVGYVERTRGDLEEAERWYRRAAEGGHAGAYLNLGVLLRDRGAVDEAKQCYERAWELESDDKAASNLGAIYDDDGKGDLVAAAEWYGRAADAGNAIAAYNLGFVWQDRGEPEKRMEAWRRAAELKHPDAADAIAGVHLERQNVNEAVAWLRRAVLEVGNKRSARKLGDIYANAGRHRMARFWGEFPDGPTFYSPEFQAFASELSAAAIQQQDAFNDVFTMEHIEWDPEEATMTLDGRTLRGLTVLGSFSNLSQIWLWTWDNPSWGQDLPSLAKLRTIREFGERHQIPELIKGHLDFSRFNHPAEGAFTMALSVAPLIGAKGVSFVTVNDGKGRLVLAADDPSLPGARFDRPAVPRLLMRAAEVWPQEQRRVVRGFMERHGFEIAESPAVIVVESADGHRVTVRCPLERAKEHIEVNAVLSRDGARIVENTPARIQGRRADGDDPYRLAVLFDLDDRVTSISGGVEAAPAG